MSTADSDGYRVERVTMFFFDAAFRLNKKLSRKYNVMIKFINPIDEKKWLRGYLDTLAKKYRVIQNNIIILLLKPAVRGNFV
jgi:hypothetical protein